MHEGKYFYFCYLDNQKTLGFYKMYKNRFCLTIYLQCGGEPSENNSLIENYGPNKILRSLLPETELKY